MSDSLAVLQQAFPAPAGVRPADWGPIEAELGVALPAGYKALCDLYADAPIGAQGEQIRLLAPQADEKGHRFPAAALAENAILRGRRDAQLEDRAATPVPDLRTWRFVPEDGGLLPWATDGSLLMFFEVDVAADPDGWRIVAPVACDTGDIKVVDLAVVDETDAAGFLVRVLDAGSARDPEPAADVDESWARIEEVLASDHPDAHAALRDGAGEHAIAAAEAELGARLPEPYRRSLLRHDGQEHDAPSLVEGGDLCSLEDLLRGWRSWTRMQDAGDLDGFEIDADPDPEVRGDRWWRRGWLPFVERDGDHLVLDLDPAPQGHVGQVFAFSHETGAGRLAAPDVAAWLEIWADELQAGIVMPHPIVDDDDEDGDLDIDPSRTWPF